jgi:hypothetical protein
MTGSGRHERAKNSATASGWLLIAMAVNPAVRGMAAGSRSSHAAEIAATSSDDQRRPSNTTAGGRHVGSS